MKKLIIFDLDGTLLNTLEDLYLSCNYALEKFGYPIRSKEEVRTFVGNGVKVLMEKAAPEGLYSDKLLEEFKTYYQIHSMDNISVYDGILNLLYILKERGYILAVASNKYDKAVKEICDKYFNGIFDLCLGETPNIPKKPNPDMLLYIMNKFNVTISESLYIGDSDVDILVGKNTKVDTIIVSYGFRKREELLGANTIIDKPEEVLRYLN